MSALRRGGGFEAVGSADHGHRGCCIACVQGRVDLKQPDVVFWLVICESSNNSGIPETVRDHEDQLLFLKWQGLIGSSSVLRPLPHPSTESHHSRPPP